MLHGTALIAFMHRNGMITSVTAGLDSANPCVAVQEGLGAGPRGARVPR